MAMSGILFLVLTAWIIHLQTALEVDFDGNGRVDFLDFVAFAQAFGSSQAKYDLNGSGTVDFGDFVTFARAFGATSGMEEPEDMPRLRKYGVEHPVFDLPVRLIPAHHAHLGDGLGELGRAIGVTAVVLQVGRLRVHEDVEIHQVVVVGVHHPGYAVDG